MGSGLYSERKTVYHAGTALGAHPVRGKDRVHPTYAHSLTIFSARRCGYRALPEWEVRNAY